ncbi:hypothetical protein ACFQY9_17355 [Microvirga aerilata]|uniref:hypothetical protein n=1 Tax=Microvirga aerilata TaxID=670292 RepID=UPI003632CD8A
MSLAIQVLCTLFDALTGSHIQNERDLFGPERLVCNWRRNGTNSSKLVAEFAPEVAAGWALWSFDAVIATKKKRPLGALSNAWP